MRLALQGQSYSLETSRDQPNQHPDLTIISKSSLPWLDGNNEPQYSPGETDRQDSPLSRVCAAGIGRGRGQTQQESNLTDRQGTSIHRTIDVSIIARQDWN